MRIEKLKLNPDIYTGNSYYIRGDYNRIDDVNTLIDTGTDSSVVDALAPISQGLGKRKVDLVVLTHEHFDHAGGLKHIRELVQTGLQVIAFSENKNIRADTIAYDGMKVKIGDTVGTILHTPSHSHDSISILFNKEKVLFSGDVSLDVKMRGNTFTAEYIINLVNFLSLKLEAIYPGHGDPIFSNERIQPMLRNTYYNVIGKEAPM